VKDSFVCRLVSKRDEERMLLNLIHDQIEMAIQPINVGIRQRIVMSVVSSVREMRGTCYLIYSMII
jgi:hypothetical protein